MRRRLAKWMLATALKMEPLFAIGIQQAADERACVRLRQALAEAQHAENVSRIAQSN